MFKNVLLNVRTNKCLIRLFYLFDTQSIVIILVDYGTFFSIRLRRHLETMIYFTRIERESIFSFSTNLKNHVHFFLSISCSNLLSAVAAAAVVFFSFFWLIFVIPYVHLIFVEFSPARKNYSLL